MSSHRYNPRFAKIHRSYTVEEVARLYDIHKNTVRQWIKNGLPVCDKKRPMLILGKHLREYLETKRAKNKCSLKPNEIYCVRCRVARVPAENMIDYEPVTETSGNLIGICPTCKSMMNRRAKLTLFEQIRTELAVT